MSILEDALKRLENSRLDSLGIKSPFTIPSGIVTTSPGTLALVAEEIPEIGFLTTKTISVAARPGYREPIIHEYAAGCFSNAVGLANPGARAFLDQMRRRLPLAGEKPLIVSIMGGSPADFLECALMLETVASAFELNLSCPHVSEAGQTVGSDPEMVAQIVGLLRERLQKPIIAKLSPNVTNLVHIAQTCAQNGADGLCLINTVGPGIVTDTDGAPVLTNVMGGLSGAAALPIGIRSVREVAAAVDLPIIACGGVSEPSHVRAYYQAGACLFGVGSALAGFTTEQIAEFFSDLVHDMEHGPGRSCVEQPLRRPNLTTYLKTKVMENRTFGEGLTEIKLEEGPSCRPGQFFFIRLAGVGEKPFSPASDEPPIYLARKVGPFTDQLQRLAAGTPIFLRGPYGNGFPEPQKDRPLVLVGGGSGIAPLMMAAKRWKDRVTRAYAGFSSAVDRRFRYDLAGRIPYCKVVIDPPDERGEMVKVLREDIREDPGAYYKAQFFVSGPRPMMEEVVKLLRMEITDPLIHIAREDIMRCGIGLCGSCATEDGQRSCVDGPIMTPPESYTNTI
jgi:dihydroorotate dehydrogenase (NAD+) catalytic subunit